MGNIVVEVQWRIVGRIVRCGIVLACYIRLYDCTTCTSNTLSCSLWIIVRVDVLPKVGNIG